MQDFLDVTGRWDPSLAFVMGGAVLVTWLSFPRVLAQPKPLLASSFTCRRQGHRRQADRRVALFGIGWGMAASVPVRRCSASSLGSRSAIWFVAAMLAGMMLEHTYQRLRSSLRQ